MSGEAFQPLADWATENGVESTQRAAQYIDDSGPGRADSA